jgi:hypothetical protein
VTAEHPRLETDILAEHKSICLCTHEIKQHNLNKHTCSGCLCEAYYCNLCTFRHNEDLYDQSSIH